MFSHFINSLWGIVNEMSPYILLGFIIAGLLHVFVRPSAMSRHLSGGGLKPVVKAALLGIPLPLCSCGVLPTAVALRRQGASRGATTSFLIATPQTGVDSIAATYSLLGLPFAILRPLAALVGSVLGGGAVAKWAGNVNDKGLDVEGVECSDGCCGSDFSENEYKSMSLPRRLLEAIRYGLVDMVASVGKWLVIGLVIAALITVLVPDSLFVSLSRYPLAAMLVMILVAVPMYVCATGSIPIALSLMLKGLTPGVAFVLLMAGPAANFASVMILSRTMGRRATIIYVASVVVTAVGFGLLIDLLLPGSWFMPTGASAACCHGHEETSWFATACSVLLAGLLIYTSLRRYNHDHGHTHNHSKQSDKQINMEQTFNIKGMNCPHCQAAVTRAIQGVSGTETVDVNLSTGVATVTGSPSPEEIRQAVFAAGFDVE
ncbi:MAG: SO_0444 family Cu/Zn efflux transporter [Duncaniella sp.]|nr:SO_0444 family Cu/Zn efflux transporter [Duncaniella sp.]